MAIVDDVDDEDTKIRRNLLVVSSAILLTSWLDVPASSLFEKLFGGVHPQSEIWKFLVAELSVLIYLAIRYRFSSEGEGYVMASEEEWNKFRCFKSVDLTVARAHQFEKTGKEPSIFSNQLSAGQC